MIKQMAVVTRRPGMTKDEYINHIKHIHGYQITASNPLTILKYNQNYVYDSAYGAKADVLNGGYHIIYNRDSITELYFESVESMIETFSDPYVEHVVGPDGLNFAELSKQMPLLVSEEEIEVPNPAVGGCKLYYFIKKNDEISDENFQELLFEAHNEVICKSPVLSKQLRRFVNNVQLKGSMDTFFGGDNELQYDCIATMWFDTVPAFRQYQAELEAAAKSKNNFIDCSRSFVLFTDELTIYKK